MDDAMLLMQAPEAFDRAVADAAERLRETPDCSWHSPEAWD